MTELAKVTRLEDLPEELLEHLRTFMSYLEMIYNPKTILKTDTSGLKVKTERSLDPTSKFFHFIHKNDWVRNLSTSKEELLQILGNLSTENYVKYVKEFTLKTTKQDEELYRYFDTSLKLKFKDNVFETFIRSNMRVPIKFMVNNLVPSTQLASIMKNPYEKHTRSEYMYNYAEIGKITLGDLAKKIGVDSSELKPLFDLYIDLIVTHSNRSGDSDEYMIDIALVKFSDKDTPIKVPIPPLLMSNWDNVYDYAGRSENALITHILVQERMKKIGVEK